MKKLVREAAGETKFGTPGSSGNTCLLPQPPCYFEDLANSYYRPSDTSRASTLIWWILPTEMTFLEAHSFSPNPPAARTCGCAGERWRAAAWDGEHGGVWLGSRAGGRLRDRSLQLLPSREPLAGKERLGHFCCLFNSSATCFCAA